MHKGVLIVPQHYDRHHEWEDEGIFSLEKPLHIEYCSGNGDWIIEKARSNPDQKWVAVEKQFERVRKIWSKRENMDLKNLLIVCGQAEEFTQFYLPGEIAQEIYVNFPDPWPKERHAKHRLIQAPFVEQFSRVVRADGTFTFVTDDAPYSARVIEEMGRAKNWEFAFKEPYYTSSWEGYGSSWFENLWREKGREIYYIQCNKVST